LGGYSNGLLELVCLSLGNAAHRGLQQVNVLGVRVASLRMLAADARYTFASEEKLELKATIKRILHVSFM
jgi:hypothetical protein